MQVGDIMTPEEKIAEIRREVAERHFNAPTMHSAAEYGVVIYGVPLSELEIGWLSALANYGKAEMVGFGQLKGACETLAVMLERGKK